MEKVENKWKSEETICYIWNQQKVNIKNSFKLLKQKWLSNRKMGKGHGKLMKSTGYVREGKKEKNKSEIYHAKWESETTERRKIEESHTQC